VWGQVTVEGACKGVAGCWLLNGRQETEQNSLAQEENRQNSFKQSQFKKWHSFCLEKISYNYVDITKLNSCGIHRQNTLFLHLNALCSIRRQFIFPLLGFIFIFVEHSDILSLCKETL